MSQLAKRARLSVAMIVRDAEELLSDSIKSVRSIADEILIADTGSADNTIDVALGYGAKVIERPWQHDFSAARNVCLTHVTGDWVLWLDAGDRLSRADAARLRQQIDQAPSPNAAYLMFVEVPAAGPSAAERIAQVRLAPRHPLIKFAGRVRESLIESLQAARVGIEPLDVYVRRHPREHQPNIKQAKARRNILLAEAEIRDTGSRPELFNCLGDALQTLQEHDRAIQCFRHALQVSVPGSPEQLEAYYGIITSLDGKPQQRDEQLATCMRALEAYPMDAQLLCAMGGYLQAQGQTELAMRAYETTYRYGQVNPGVWHVSDIYEIAAVCWSLTLQLLGRQDEARQALIDALSNAPESQRLRRQLLENYIKAGQRERALEQLDRFPSDFPERDALRSAVRGACLAAGNQWLEAKAYLQAAYEAGCLDPICLRWYATTLIAVNEMHAAAPIVQQWLRIEPASPIARQLLEFIEHSESRSAEENSHRQVRIDASETQRTHLAGRLPRSPLPHAAPTTRLPRQP